MFHLFLTTWLVLGNGSIKKQVLLNAKNSSQSEASITLNPQSTIIVDTQYDIHVHFQDSYDLKLSLKRSWGFESSTISTFTLKLDGITPFPDYDADCIIVFSVGDLQYFSFFLHLDTNNINSRIYPSVSMDKNTQKVSEWISDIDTIRQRWHRVSNDDHWISLDQWNQQSLWPLTFVISNNPKTDQSIFEFYHNTSSFAVGYTFDAAFASDQPIDVYIMGQSTFETFSISSFNIALTNESTSFPTVEPTSSPTSITRTPTSEPTLPIIDMANSLTQFANVSQIGRDTNTKQSQTSHKSQAIIIVMVILIAVIMFFCVIIALKKFCKPVSNERKVSFDHNDDDDSTDSTDSTDYPNSTHTDSESNITQQNEYMNEGPLTPVIYNMRYINRVQQGSNSTDYNQSSFAKKNTEMDESQQISSQSDTMNDTEMIHVSNSRSNTIESSKDTIVNYCISFN